MFGCNFFLFVFLKSLPVILVNGEKCDQETSNEEKEYASIISNATFIPIKRGATLWFTFNSNYKDSDDWGAINSHTNAHLVTQVDRPKPSKTVYCPGTTDQCFLVDLRGRELHEKCFYDGSLEFRDRCPSGLSVIMWIKIGSRQRLKLSEEDEKKTYIINDPSTGLVLYFDHSTKLWHVVWSPNTKGMVMCNSETASDERRWNHISVTGVRGELTLYCNGKIACRSQQILERAAFQGTMVNKMNIGRAPENSTVYPEFYLDDLHLTGRFYSPQQIFAYYWSDRYTFTPIKVVRPKCPK